MSNYPKAIITYTRASVDTPSDQRINAILAAVCTSADASALRFNGYEYIPNFYEPLSIGRDIYFHLIATQEPIVKAQTSYTVEPITFNLYSENGTIECIHRFVNELVERYEHEKKNRLGNEIYYFDMIVEEPKRGIPQKGVSFRKSRFHTNRRLEHVYFAECADLRKRLDFFMHHKDWYDRKGIPHTLGIVMYGEPGCGKTSTIKAIANETKRHIFNVLLSEIKTKEALKNLFFNDVVTVNDGEMISTLNIPVRNRIYIIEDIDRMNSVVLKSEPVVSDEHLSKKRELENFLPSLKLDDHDKLDLATLLNVLDGVRETPGRIIILSTNHPERLDDALLRPGRFDVLIHFKKHDRAILKQHILDFYDMTSLTEGEDELLTNACLDGKWTPAEASQVLFKYIDDRVGAIRTLINEDPRTLFSLKNTPDIVSSFGLK